MNWTEVKITTNDAGIEPITGILLSIGITGLQIESPSDFTAFLEQTEPHWDYVDESLMALQKGDTKVILYLPENTQGADQLAMLKQALADLKAGGDYGSLEISMTGVKEEDWENNWKQYFKPFATGKKILIKPSWETVENPENRKILEIDPGSSFGTGTHETTHMCLEAMEQIIKEGDRVLDLGCGSGILSIGALLLGASCVKMADIDQNAVRIAKENANKNGFSDDRVTAFCGNLVTDTGLREKLGCENDVILANIVADVLIAMAPYFAKFLKKDGTLLLSGIITERQDEVLSEVQKHGFSVKEIFHEGHWACAYLTR